MTDHNTPEYLDKIRESVVELLKTKTAAPSVQMHRKSSFLIVVAL
jgi:histone deacetylase 1/2